VAMWVQTSFASELGLVMRRERDFEVELRDWGGKEPVLENEKRKGKGLGGRTGEGECLLFSCSTEPLGTRDCGQAVSFVSILLRIVLTFRAALLNGEQPIESGVVEMDVWGGGSEHGRHHIVQKTARNRPLMISNLELLQTKFMMMFWIYMSRILASSGGVRRQFQLETIIGIE
jgi:hypothetical protein